MSFGQQGFHLLLVVSMVIFLVTGAGACGGSIAGSLRERSAFES